MKHKNAPASSPGPADHGAEQRTQSEATHDESLLDESLEETFPASDAPAETQPGSLASRAAERKRPK
jgi:hypothetical protein